jgi:hypothetical protein
MQSSSGFLMLLALYTFIALSNPTKKVIEPEKMLLLFSVALPK